MKVGRPLSRRLSWAPESREVLETGLRDWSHSLFKRYNATLVNSHFIPVQISSTLISLMEAVLLHCDGKGSPWWILQVDSGKVVHFQTWSAASHLSCIILVPFLFMIHYDQGPERRNWETTSPASVIDAEEKCWILLNTLILSSQGRVLIFCWNHLKMWRHVTTSPCLKHLRRLSVMQF